MLDWPVFLWRVARDTLRDRAGVYALDAPYRTKYLSQPGIALSCAAFGGLPYVMLRTDRRPQLLQLDAYASIRDGDRVWIRIEDLERFVGDVLPGIEGRIVLVTGDSDHEVPGAFAAAADRVAESGLVTKWFTTNYDGRSHPQLIAGLPIGLNYARKNELIGALDASGPLRVDLKSAAAQEQEWEAIAAAAPPLQDRMPRAVADFHLRDSSRSRKYGESRSDIQRRLHDNRSIVWLGRRRPLPELLSIYAAHAFVVSPHGNALDCYRTWEALLAGCVPIVKRSAIDHLYAGLPVAIVDDWGEITAANCERWLAQFGAEFDRAPLSRALSAEHWLRRIHGPVC